MANYDLLTEDAKPLAKLRKVLPGSRGAAAIHPATLRRWAARGIRRPDGTLVKLQTIRVGASVMSSEAAVRRFLDELNAPSSGPPTSTPTAKKRAAERADAALAEVLG